MDRLIFPSTEAFHSAVTQAFSDLAEAVFAKLSPELLLQIGFISNNPERRLQTVQEDWEKGNRLILGVFQLVSINYSSGTVQDFVEMLHAFIKQNCMEAFLQVAPTLDIDDEEISEEDLAAAFAEAPTSVARSAQILLMIWWACILPAAITRLSLPYMDEIKTLMSQRRNENLVSLEDWGM